RRGDQSQSHAVFLHQQHALQRRADDRGLQQRHRLPASSEGRSEEGKGGEERREEVRVMPTPLDDLQHRIDALKSEVSPPPETEPTQAEGLSKAMRIGGELVAGVAVGAAFGYFLDRWLGTTPWLMIVCFFL